MSNSTPDQEAPVTLRASTALSPRREEARAPGNESAAPVRAGLPEEAAPAAPVLAVGAVAVLLAAGWLLQRRRRLAQRPAQHSAVAARESMAIAPPPAAPTTPTTPAVRTAAAQPVDDAAIFAAQFQDEPVALQPQQFFAAPLQHRHSHLGVPGQKRLIKGLLWVRTLAGGAAMLAAIAIVVFWAIETTDMRAGDTGLTRPLLMLLLVAWAASWGAGQLANHLHRAFFGRVHPKFDN